MNTESTSRRCPECGATLVADAIYCDRCGRLASSSTVVESPHAPDAPSRPTSQVLQFSPLTHSLFALLVVATVFALVYRVNSQHGLTQTYATFVGLPLLIGVLTTYLTRPQSGIGMTLKVTTVILCVVCPLLGEGSVCILMAAPLFYGIAVIGYMVVEGIVRLVGQKRRPLCCLGVVVVPFLAGAFTTTPTGLRNPATLTVTDQAMIGAPPEAVWDTLLHRQMVSNRFPWFLQLGFPLPIRLDRVQDKAVLHFNPGSEPWPGTNTIVSRPILEEAHHQITFQIEKDGTKLSRWLTFRSETFTVVPAPGGCRLTETTVFRQRMQPAVYWNPLEGLAAGQMHAYALDSIRRLAEESAGRQRSSTVTVTARAI